MIFSKKFVAATKEFETYGKIVPAPYMRRTVEFRSLPKTASLTVTGLGFYKLFVNGKEITKGLLAPYISNSDQTVYYDNYDILPYLVKGKNVLGFILGNGMQNCIGGNIWDLEKVDYRSAPKLAFALETDKGVIEADENVKTFDSPILFNDERCGVHYDARLEVEGWNLPDFDDTAWQNAIPVEPCRGECVLCTADPVRVYEELSPVSIEKSRLSAYYGPRDDLYVDGKLIYDSSKDDVSDGFLYDFGQNNAGVVRLRIKGKKGQKVFLQFGECLDKDGCLDYKNIHFYMPGFVQRDIYICKGSGEEEIFVPDFTYHGFRYCFVGGITKAQATEELLTYLVAGSDFKERGSFSCSDDIANKLQAAVRRSDRSNFYYFPTDCPHREKNGWTGDASMSSEHMLLNLSVEESYKAWLISIKNAQRLDGALPGIIPTGGWGFAWGNGPVWDSVLFNIPYYMYIYRGDIQPVCDYESSMMRYLNYVANRRDELGLLHIGLGDWCPVGKDSGDFDAPLELTDSICTMDIARKAGVMFRAAGFDTQAVFCDKLYSELRCAIRKNLVDFNTMTAAGSCESSQALCIALGVFDTAEKPEAFTRLLEFVAANDDHIDTGFYGGRYLFHVLSDFGEADLAYKMITRTDYPSYGHWIARGETTLRECFWRDGDSPASCNHHFWGDISAWFIKAILGIRVNPYENNAKYVELKPNFIETLEHAEGYYDTVCGKLSVKWQRVGEEIKYTVKVPKGISGKLCFPFGYKANKSVLPLASGTYTVSKYI